MTAIQVTDEPTITLGAHGVPGVWAIFSSPEARAAYAETLRASDLRFDYWLDWRDAQGWGLEVSYTIVTVARRLVAFLSGTAR